MYSLSEKQVEYILCDIRRNGVELEDLQLNLLDHICCILERELKDGDDFEAAYHETVRLFYIEQLSEIEDETIRLLTFKHYYKMKKIMLGSGAVSVAAFITGSFFKIMNWPGASLLLAIGMVVLCLIFLPLLAILKSKEYENLSGKLVSAAGALTGMLYVAATMFAIFRWEGRTALWIGTVAVSMFVFLPAYLYHGLRRDDTRLNTILTSVLVVGFTLSIFTLVQIR